MSIQQTKIEYSTCYLSLLHLVLGASSTAQKQKTNQQTKKIQDSSPYRNLHFRGMTIKSLISLPSLFSSSVELWRDLKEKYLQVFSSSAWFFEIDMKAAIR